MAFMLNIAANHKCEPLQASSKALKICQPEGEDVDRKRNLQAVQTHASPAFWAFVIKSRL
jgi:hypothetical protein